MTKPVKDIAASIRQRLTNVAKESGRPFQEVFEYYAMERFLYRLAQSPHAKRFVLKGALMFRAWGGAATRPTRDIDLLARIKNTIEAVVPVFREICSLTVEPDGLIFDSGSVQGAVIKEDADYSGVRITFLGTLQNARVSMQIDVGFADVMTPGPVLTDYPVILELPAPRLSGYPKETVIAEKFEAMVKLGTLNSRMKDFYDILILSRRFEFDGATLADAIMKTFANRKIAVVPTPIALTPAFAATSGKEAQWKGFIRKAKLEDVPVDLATVTAELAVFLMPVVATVSAGSEFNRAWKKPGTWV